VLIALQFYLDLSKKKVVFNQRYDVNFKRILGIVICLCGLALIGASFYIHNQVAEGRGQIAAGQQKIDRTNKLFSITPQTKDVGSTLTKSGQERVNAGTMEADQYEALANKLQIAGIALVIVGAGIAILCGRRKR
jgi:hypothetical protein